MLLQKIYQWKQNQQNKKLIIDTLTNTYDFWDSYRANYSAFDKIINIKYGTRKLFLNPSEDEAECWQTFNEMFDAYLVGGAYEYQRKWDALKAEYNPIENYDRKEDSTTTRDAKTDTTKMPQIQTTSSGGTTTTEDETSPFDSDYKDAAKSTSVVPETWTKQSAHNIDTDYGEDKTTVNSRVHGNVGVTTNQQMITAELELRSNVFISDIIREIINNISYY